MSSPALLHREFGSPSRELKSVQLLTQGHKKKCSVYFSFMPLNWVMQPFILLPGTGHIRLKLSTSLPLLCEFKHPQVSTAFRPFVSPLEVQSYAVPMFLRRCLHVEIMIQARNHTHILKRNEMFTVLCHLREEDNNILE